MNFKNLPLIFRTLLLVGLLYDVRISFAQTEFRPGYVINNSSDTIKGEIDYRLDLLMGQSCKFKKDNTILEYQPGDIQAYRFNDGRYFISKVVNGDNIFLEFLIQGRANIYYFQDQVADHYYIQKDDHKYKFIELVYESGIKTVKNTNNTAETQIIYESKKHIGLLNYYMLDAPTLAPKIKVMKKPTRKNLIKLAEEYHNIVSKDEACIIFEKNKNSTALGFEWFLGAAKYSLKEIPDNLNPQIGFIFHIPVRLGDEKNFIKTGLIHTVIKEQEGETETFDVTHVFRIPLHYEYSYPTGLIRPRLSYGPNIQLQKFANIGRSTVSLNAGLNIRLKERLLLSATSEFEFAQQGLIFPDFFIGYSLNIGILARFSKQK